MSKTVKTFNQVFSFQVKFLIGEVAQLVEQSKKYPAYQVYLKNA